MLLIGLAIFLKHGTPVQNEQIDVKLGVFHMELFTKYANKKSWLWQSRIFTENLTIGRTEYKIAEHQLSRRPIPATPERSGEAERSTGEET